MTVTILLVLICATLALGQRPFFAGSRPIGYPEVAPTTTALALGDRFGEVNGTTTTLRPLPLEANGDRELVDRLSKLPIDKQPFWLINWQALQANREKPQSYPQKPNQFVDPIEGTSNTGTASFNSANVNSNSETPSVNTINPAIVNSNSNSLPASNGNVLALATSNSFGADEIPKVPSKDQVNSSPPFTNSNPGSDNLSSNSENSRVVPVKKQKPYFVQQAYYL